MKTSPKVITVIPYDVYTCGRCNMFYHAYKQLLEHLYWRHGTESQNCKDCGLKLWQYAAHMCNVLPVDELELEDYYENEEHCFCGKQFEDVPMIGCDGPECTVQWYHFSCVGIVVPPEGDWLCPDCSKVSLSR